MIVSMLQNNISKIIIISPVFITILLFIIHNKRFHHTWRSIHFTTEVTSFIFVGVNLYMLEKIVPFTITGYVIIVLLLILMAILIQQRKKDMDVSLSKAIKLLARALFIVALIAYICLITYKIIQIMSV